MIIEHIKVRISVDITPSIIISNIIATFLQFLIKPLLIGLPDLGVDGTSCLKSIRSVVWILKLLHDAVVHSLMRLLLLIEGISLVKVGLLVDILTTVISTILITGLCECLNWLLGLDLGLFGWSGSLLLFLALLRVFFLLIVVIGFGTRFRGFFDVGFVVVRVGIALILNLDILLVSMLDSSSLISNGSLRGGSRKLIYRNI